jgi:hypothetical protein
MNSTAAVRATTQEEQGSTKAGALIAIEIYIIDLIISILFL